VLNASELRDECPDREQRGILIGTLVVAATAAVDRILLRR
jgi:hypothetical protein